MPATSDRLTDSKRTFAAPSIDRSVGAARCAVIMAPIVLTGCQPAVLDPQGPIGIAEKTILIDSLAIMLAIVVPTIIATFGFRLVVSRLQHAGRPTCRIGNFPAASNSSSGPSRCS